MQGKRSLAGELLVSDVFYHTMGVKSIVLANWKCRILERPQLHSYSKKNTLMASPRKLAGANALSTKMEATFQSAHYEYNRGSSRG